MNRARFQLIATVIVVTLLMATFMQATLKVDALEELDHPNETADACFSQAVALLKENKRNEAIVQFKKAVCIKPDLANAWYNLGELYAATGKLEEAGRSLRTYLELVPAGTRAEYAQSHLKLFDTYSARSIKSNTAPDYLDQLNTDEKARWPANKSNLKVFVQSGDQVAGYEPDYRKELIAAFQSWSKACDGQISFTYVDDLKDADILVEWSKDLSDVLNKNENGECRVFLKKGTREIERAFIFLLTKPSLKTEMSPILMFNVCLHEIGHAMGIVGHSSNPSDTMYFFSLPDKERHNLSDRDAQTLNRLYLTTDAD